MWDLEEGLASLRSLVNRYVENSRKSEAIADGDGVTALVKLFVFG